VQPIEEYVQDSAKQLYFSWLTSTANELGERKVAAYFAKKTPDAYKDYIALETNQDARPNIADFIHHLRSNKSLAFREFKVNLLEPHKLSMEHYLRTTNPNTFSKWEAYRDTPGFNIHGSLPDYINLYNESDIVLQEARIVLRDMGVDEDYLPTGDRRDINKWRGAGDRSVECNCEVGLSATALLPTSNDLVVNPEIVIEDRKSNGSLKKKTVRQHSTMGLAHSARIHRVTYNGRENEISLDPLVEASHQVSLWMECINNLGLECGSMSGCNAEVVTAAHYYSDLNARIDIHDGGLALTKNGIASAAESINLNWSTPGLGSSHSQDLLFKELETSVSYNKDVDIGQLLSLVGVGITATTAGLTAATATGATAASVSASVLPEAAGGLLYTSGLVKTTGNKNAELLEHLNGVYSTSDEIANIPLHYADGITKLTFKSEVALNAEGKNSGSNSGWAEANSSYAWAIGVKNFSCTADVTNTPDEVSYWTYGTTPSSPATSASLQNVISYFLDAEMGVEPDFSTGNSGEIVTVTPEYPPVAICSITPSLGVNFLSAVMSGTSSYDPDGDITSATFEWVRHPGHFLEDVIATGASSFLTISDAPVYYAGPAGIHLRVTDTQGLVSTSYCGDVRVLCVEEDGTPCPIPVLEAAPMKLSPYFP
jgi:hypothetical protein